MTTINQFNMKKILFLLTITAAFILSSCDKESLGVSKVTTYAILELNGNGVMFWPMNTAFVDPGCLALVGTEDISSQVIAESDVDITTGGAYTINYKVKNADGFWAYASRKVYIYEASAPLNGYYASRIRRDNNGAVANRGPFTILVYGVGNDKYYVQDLLGGWYCYGNNYGVAYLGNAIVKLTGNAFSIISAAKLPWGYPCVLTTGTTSTYDASTKTIVLNTNMADVPTMKFTVTMNNPQPL